MRRAMVRVEKEVHQAWTAALDSMKRMGQGIVVRPEVPSDVFIRDYDVSDDIIKFKVVPVVFNVPERANTGRSNLFVVVDGWMSFDAPHDRGVTERTNAFGTRVAYFRKKKDCLEHIFGVHYDMDESGKGHPIFHAQMRSRVEFGQSVRERFRLQVEGVDYVNRICRTVRMPSAQMDVFSVVIQICGDHLLWEQSPPTVENAFEKAQRVCGFFGGAAYRFPILQEKEVCECYRAGHWYRAGTNAV